ncbi:PAS domain S-box protein, partial [bacterium]|nr:PAS domain S-box protein [bacterium]
MKPNNKKSARYSKPTANRMILIAIGLSAFFWLFDAVLDFLVFGFPGDFISQLFTPSPHEVWIRLIVVGILITFAIYAQFTITRRKQAEESLKQERDFSRSILQTANSMIFCLDADARITVFNDECERITGYSRDEVFGKRWPDLFLPPDKRHASLKSFVNWVRAHPRDSYEGPVVTKSGQIKTILCSNTSIIGSDPMDVTAIAIGCDVTERKQAEQELEKER